MEKRCAKCKQIKPSTEFYIFKRNHDGFHSYCKLCNKKITLAYSKTPKGKSTQQKQNAKQLASGYYLYGKGAISKLRVASKNRGFTFDLTAKQFAKWWKSTPDNCRYCARTPAQFIMARDYIIAYTGDNWSINRYKRVFNNKNHAKIYRMTLDRMDNAKGYTLDNITKACWICNYFKGDFLEAHEMYAIAIILKDTLYDDIFRERLRSGEKKVSENMFFEDWGHH